MRLFDDIEPSINFGWLVYPSRTHLSLTTRTFIDFMLANVVHDPTFTAQPEDIRKLLI
ncbi:hypothetical protein L4D76_24645 [Photobacterium sagamiensis]|uniref:hypothetical protein n=1 Tax=Photobacterium sagamiensis TaxID=2910241 RepID=UPI003D0FABCA